MINSISVIMMLTAFPQSIIMHNHTLYCRLWLYHNVYIHQLIFMQLDRWQTINFPGYIMQLAIQLAIIEKSTIASYVCERVCVYACMCAWCVCVWTIQSITRYEQWQHLTSATLHDRFGIESISRIITDKLLCQLGHVSHMDAMKLDYQTL